jgi:sentrin-specific protease 7
MNQAEVSGLLCVGMHETNGGEESYAAEYPKMDQDTSHETAKFDVVMASSAMYTDTDNIHTSGCLDEYHMSGIQAMEEIRFGSAQPLELQPKVYYLPVFIQLIIPVLFTDFFLLIVNWLLSIREW